MKIDEADAVKRFTRRALYELVWSKPMRDAATENGISDVGLVKVCRAAGIPTPPQGYWNKVHAGKPTVRVELPPRPPGMPDEVTFGGSRYRSFRSVEPPASDEEEPALLPPIFEEDLSSVMVRIRKDVGRVPLYNMAAKPHPLVARLLEADDLRRQQHLATGYSWDEPVFDTPFEKRRLSLLNRLFIALTALGHKPSIHGKEARDLCITVGKEHVNFDLDGASRKKPEGWRQTGYSHFKFKSDEKLRMNIAYPTQAQGMQWSWTDGDQDLEAHVTDIVVSLVCAGEIHYRASIERMHQWEVEQQQRRREERHKQREEAERQERLRIEKEKHRRFQGLVKEANRLRRAREIREYVAAMRAALRSDTTEVDHVEFERWCAWASNCADLLDPTRHGVLRERFNVGDGTSADER